MMDSGQKKTFLLNGEALSELSHQASFENSGFLWGQSVFTTGLILKGRLSFFTEHEERLKKASTWMFGKDYCPSLNELLAPLATLGLELNSMPLKIRITLYENLEQIPQSLVEVSQFQSGKGNPRAQIIEAPILSKSRPSYVKIGSYAETLRLRKSMSLEPIFVDPHGNLMEGAVANILFFDKLHKTWVSPMSEYSFVEGLGLRVGLKTLDVRKKSIVKENLNLYSAAFFINSLRGANAISEINEFKFENSLAMEDELNDIFKVNSNETARELWPMEK